MQAGIYATNALCHSQGGAGTNGYFNGAMVCGSVRIYGNWTYDSSVDALEGAEFGVRNWAERPPATAGGPPSA